VRLRGIYKVSLAFAAAALVVCLAAAASLSTLRQLQAASEAREYSAHILVLANELLASHAVVPERVARQSQDLRTLAAGRASEPALADMLSAIAGSRPADEVRAAGARFIQTEVRALNEQRSDFDRWMRRTLFIILIICGLALLFPLSFSYQMHKASQDRLKDLAHADTRRLLEVQEDVNRRLQEMDLALREKNTLLEAATAIAEKANHAKSDFLSSMSHELRTPLNAILGFTQLMESGGPAHTPAQKRNLGQILKAGWYLLELINQILDLAVIESGKVTLSREPVRLLDVMLECRSMIEPEAQKRGIGMVFPSFNVPVFVNADRTRVKQVLINLLFNAIKYNTAGGRVTVSCTLGSADTVRISVRDTGLGLAPEQLALLFQPFNRLGKDTGGEEGTGIGLVVTKRLVEMMGGSIGVESAVGSGSVFWIELASASAPQLSAGPAPITPPATPGAAGTEPARTVLYVEDNPANLELVEQILARRPDLKLLGAADATIGIGLARLAQPHAILMDINLPGLGGVEAMQILRLDPSTRHIPVIALSANAMPRDVEHALAAGFFDYITKPIKVPELVTALDAALKFSGPAIAPSTSAKEVA
jgi:signal transduction histidine kinase/CheY-like chemotaxis protein